MPRHIWSVLAVATLFGSASIASAQATGRPVYQQASLLTTSTTLQGLVKDERGRGVGSVMVSALALNNSISKMAVSDAEGRFSLALPPGAYVLRALRDGYSASRAQILVPNTQAVEHNIVLVKQSTAVLAARPVMLAGIGGSSTPSGTAASAAKPSADADDHVHDELAWRLRQLTRTALRDVAPVTVPDSQARSFKAKNGSIFDWAFVTSVRAASFITNTPFTGQINLLTSSTLGPSSGLSPVMPRGIAYGVVGAPVGKSGDWTMRGALNSGDGSSWAVLGEYRARESRPHAFRFGLSYSLQSFSASSPASVVNAPGNSHSAGGVYLSDRWHIAPRLEFDYGARLDRFDYVSQGALISPRAGVRVGVLPTTFLVASSAQRMVAPGADEFLPPVAGPWLPPERTFEPIGSLSFVAERVRHDEFGIEHAFGRRTIGVHYFRETSANQILNAFETGETSPLTESNGHFGVANAGDMSIGGWDVRASGQITKWLCGRMDYTVAQAQQFASAETAALLAVLAPSALRGADRVHDFTTSLEASLPETSTRVSVVYQIDSAFARPRADGAAPGLGSRFNLQVNQALPFRPVSGSRMEVLIAVRNQFRDPREPGSMFDELLTVAPPLRVIGGLQIHF